MNPDDAEAKWNAVLVAVADVRRADPIAALRVLRGIEIDRDMEMERSVKAARVAGRSWAEIGEAVGVSKQTAHNRFARIDPMRWDGVSPRCAAAAEVYRDTDPCEGDQEAVRVWDSERIPDETERYAGGTLACVHHGARLYARLRYARVYPATPGREDTPALEVYHRAQNLKAADR
jgi:hypothetical protein